MPEFYDGYGEGRHHFRQSQPEPPTSPTPAVAPPPPPAPPRKRSKWPYIGAGAGACLFLLIGMAMGASTPGSSIPDAVTPPPVATAEPVADPGGVDPDAPSVTPFGERLTWASGVALEVKAPVAYRPGQYAFGATKDREVIVETTIINGSPDAFEFNSAIFGPEATHNGESASRVIDTENGLGIEPVTTIRPGKSFTFKTAFSIGQEPGELQLAYREVFAGSPALFVGNV